MSAYVLLLTSAVAGVAAIGERAEEGQRVVIEGVGPYQVCDPLFESVRIAMTQRGETWSPDYVQGISGSAFRITGPCPCAPTCGNWYWPPELVKVLGYDCEYLLLGEEGTDPQARLREVLSCIKDEIRSGRTAILWHAFTNAEFDIVCGFDESTHELLGRGSYVALEDGYAKASEARTLESREISGLLGAIVIGEKTGEFDARAAEIAALKEAVSHCWADKAGFLKGGVNCYDGWIDDLGRDLPRELGSGDWYCLAVYSSTHAAAPGFLREISPKYGDAARNLEHAADHFSQEADTLHKCFAVLGEERPTDEPQKVKCGQTADLLRQARDAYRHGIHDIERALEKIEGE